jgi:hypothetical protein
MAPSGASLGFFNSPGTAFCGMAMCIARRIVSNYSKLSLLDCSGIPAPSRLALPRFPAGYSQSDIHNFTVEMRWLRRSETILRTLRLSETIAVAECGIGNFDCAHITDSFKLDAGLHFEDETTRQT